MLKYKGEHAPFYMSAFIMDANYFRTPFPLMNWSWLQLTPNPYIFITLNYGRKIQRTSSMKFVIM